MTVLDAELLGWLRASPMTAARPAPGVRRVVHGGWVAKVCTDLPGSSRWFIGGIIAYASDSKQALGVRPADRPEAVSGRPCAVARGARSARRHRRGVSIAGPDGGAPGKPVGGVWTLGGQVRRPKCAVKVFRATGRPSGAVACR
jgi:nicotinamide-nucleotide amidase